MKLFVAILVFVFATGCSQENVEEFAFRKTLELDLIDKCGADDSCIAAVKAQIKGCMVSSDWRSFINNQEDEAELKRFVTAFYACIVDKDGNPFFESNI